MDVKSESMFIFLKKFYGMEKGLSIAKSNIGIKDQSMYWRKVAQYFLMELANNEY